MKDIQSKTEGSKLCFEVLCVDVKKDSGILKEDNILYSLMGNSNLFSDPIKKKNSINDSGTGITLRVSKVDSQDGSDEAIKVSYIINIEGNYNSLEPFRLKLILHLNNYFNTVYIVNDDVSYNIACELYPEVNKVENALRKYLVKFFVTKLGSDWWSVTADSEMHKKASFRKNNENIFGHHIDNRVYLVDFGELGKIVYQQSSGFINKEDIVSKIMAIEETSEAIKTFKGQLQNNYTKFFKDTFKDNGFQQKWEKIEKIRHKIAHNSLFSNSDFEEARKLCDDVYNIINNANKSVESIVFSSDEKEALRDNIVQNNAYKVITESELLSKLKSSEEWAAERHLNGLGEGFVGHSSFVKNYLGQAGYDIGSSFRVLSDLIGKSEVEMYDFVGSKNDYPVKAIKLSYKDI
jgi:hypothetical protein